MEQPNYKQLAEKAGISLGYASDLLKGHRPMPRPLAIMLFKESGWRHPCLGDLTGEQIDFLSELEPWTPPKKRAAA